MWPARLVGIFGLLLLDVLTPGGCCGRSARGPQGSPVKASLAVENGYDANGYTIIAFSSQGMDRRRQSPIAPGATSEPHDVWWGTWLGAPQTSKPFYVYALATRDGGTSYDVLRTRERVSLAPGEQRKVRIAEATVVGRCNGIDPDQWSEAGKLLQGLEGDAARSSRIPRYEDVACGEADAGDAGGSSMDGG